MDTMITASITRTVTRAAQALRKRDSSLSPREAAALAATMVIAMPRRQARQLLAMLPADEIVDAAEEILGEHGPEELARRVFERRARRRVGDSNALDA